MAVNFVRLLSSALKRRGFCSLSGKDKSRDALAQLRVERDPERVIDICCSAGLTPESHRDRIAFFKAVTRLREANDAEGIRRFIGDSMDRLGGSVSERAASHFMVLFGKGGLVSDAVKMFDEMPEMGIERNIKTLNSLLFSCVLAGDYGEMKRIFMEFPRKYGLDPNLETYNIVLRGFCESGNANSAHSLFAEMERKRIKPTRSTFALAIAGFYREEKFTDVGKMTTLMKKYGISPGIAIHNVRIQSLCKLKRSAEAKALLDGMLSRNMQPNSSTYGHLIHGFCREGNPEMAVRLYGEMTVERKLEPEPGCYFTLVYYLCEAGEFETAFGVCRECLATGKVPNISTMTSLVMGLHGIGKVEEAREIVRCVKKKFSRNADVWSGFERELFP